MPAGVQTFSEIRSENPCYYVDKTRFAMRLVHAGRHPSLSRPRRFGKSLFVSMFKELFEGNRDLFEGQGCQRLHHQDPVTCPTWHYILLPGPPRWAHFK